MPLHEQCRQFLDALKASPNPRWSDISVEEARAIFLSWEEQCGNGQELPQVVDSTIADDIPVRVYRPRLDVVLPVIVYFHGGGWVLGDLDSHDNVCRDIAAASECTVVAIHYRRAPEHRFPAALDDCFNATAWVAANAESLNVDPAKIVVAGDSAGGNLAAAVSLKAASNDAASLSKRICGQVLIYPVVSTNFETESYQQMAEGFGLTRETMMWFWEQYLGGQEPDHLSNLLLSESLDGLPKTHIVTAEYDVLRSDGEMYAQHLTSGGVPTTLREYDGVLHGFIHFSGIFEVGRKATLDIASIIKNWMTE